MDILRVCLNPDGNLVVTVHWMLMLVGGAILVWWLARSHRLIWTTAKSFEIDEAEIGVGPGKVKFKPNLEDMQIAYKLWVEISTRKIGLPLDFENDVIVEVYNSWYEFFKITRELIKQIPVNKVRSSESTRELVRIATEVLNKGLRPHLTLWQARFRKWYAAELDRNLKKDVSPQEIQRRYGDYEKLKESMEEVNVKLIAYRGMLEKIYNGE